MDMQENKADAGQRGKKGVERRQFKRVAASFSVVCKVHAPLAVHMNISGKDVDAVALDISEGGIGIVSNYDLPIGSIVMLRFIIFNESARGQKSRMLELQGEVRYCVLTEARAYRLGIRFMNSTQEDRQFITTFIDTNSS